MADGEPAEEGDGEPASGEPPVEAGSDDDPSAPAVDEAAGDEGTGAPPAEDHETRREAVEAKYDFDDFGPADMAEMSVEEWEAAFDPDTWITGEALLDRVAAELLGRVADGELFAVVERETVAGEPALLVYTDAEYAVVRADGSVEGEGALRRDVEPVVARCSIDSVEVTEPPPDAGLPDPASIQPGSGDLGHRLLLVVAVIQAAAGIGLLVAPVFVRLGPGAGALTTAIGIVFIGVGVLLGVLVANARLSDRFRAAEYRERLEAAGVGRDERPPFVPALDGSEEPGDGADSEGG